MKVPRKILMRSTINCVIYKFLLSDVNFTPACVIAKKGLIIMTHGVDFVITYECEFLFTKWSCISPSLMVHIICWIDTGIHI